MDSTATVATLRAMYESMASSAANFIPELNEIAERLANRDIWEGFSEEVAFAAGTSTRIVLPRQFNAILGWTRNDVGRSVFSTFSQYVEMGFGWHGPSEMVLDGLIDDGRTVHQVDFEGTFTLRVKVSVAGDAGKVIRFYGLDEDGERIYTAATGVDGINLTTVNPSADTTQQFTKVTGIQCQTAFIGRWTLWAVVSGVETQIGTYEPGENIPNYRVYKIGARETTDEIRAFCRRQFVKASAETDWVWPSCPAAIKMGFKALQLEDANKQEEADKQWGRSYAELDAQLQTWRGYQIPTLRMWNVLPGQSPIVN